MARSLADFAEAFLVGKSVGGYSERRVGVYRWWLDRVRSHIAEDPAAFDSAAITRFFATLRERGVSASMLHQAYRTLKTYTRWMRAAGRSAATRSRA